MIAENSAGRLHETDGVKNVNGSSLLSETDAIEFKLMTILTNHISKKWKYLMNKDFRASFPIGHSQRRANVSDSGRVLDASLSGDTSYETDVVLDIGTLHFLRDGSGFGAKPTST